METPLSEPPAAFFRNFVQIGIVVSNIDDVAQKLSEIFGIGPFRITDWPPPGREDVERYYYGEPGEFTARMGFTELGPIELELIQPCEGKSIWRDFLQQHGGGIHHLRFNVEALGPAKEYLAEHGIQPAQHGSGLRPGTTWMNFDTEQLLGFVIEIMNVAPGTDGRTPKIVDGKVQE